MKRTKRILSVLLSLCLVLGLFPSTAFAASGNLPFMDVNTSDWYYNAVQYAYEKGMMNGTSTTAFSPNDTTTRGMIVTILHRMEGTPAAVGTAFTDVSAGQWYSDAVSWASANGIVDGYGGGMFGPSDPITREQMAAILNRYSTHKGYATGATGSVSGFSDASQVSSYAVEPMGWAIGNGLISGTGNNTLAPKGNATRAQVATILMRFCENVAGKTNDTPAPDVPDMPDTTTEKAYTVTFDLNYGSDTRYDVKTVKEGETVGKPSNPSRSGYSFSGWYTEKSGGRQFDFKTGITSDLTLYAHWSSNSNSSGGGSYVPPDENIPTPPSGALSVSITTPNMTVTDIHQSLNGTFTAADSAPISTISWTASNAEFDGEYDQGEAVIDASSGTWIIDDIRLRPGANEVKITAEDQAGNTAQAAVTITYDSGTIAAYDESEITYFVDEDGNQQDSGYVNDVILVILDGSPEVTDEQREDALAEVCAAVNGEVIGQLNGILMYQIKVATSDYNTLNELCERIQGANQLVLSATCDLVQSANFPEVEPITEEDLNEDENPARAMNIPNDPWKDVFQGFWGQNWDESNPSGLNWWAEAVRAPSAWDYNDYFHSIQIGIVDGGIDKNHEDLPTVTSLTSNVPDDHGTHVAGVIGATANNRTGITGMVWNKKLYSYDAYRGESTTSEISKGITKLVESGCKVINNSNGADGGIDSAYIAYSGSLASGTINNLISKVTDDFIIVCAAGNDGIDSRRNGTFCSVTSGRALDHIIVVAAADKPSWGSYKLRPTSNYGDYVTVAAPGEGIFSTIISGGIDGSYGNMSGTSMAAPIVTGVVSLVWSVNDKFTAKEVKEIVASTATTNVSGYSNIWGRDDNRTYHMVNAQAAVEEAIARMNADGRVYGHFVDAHTGWPLSQIAYRVHSNSSTGPIVFSGTSDNNGYFSFEVPAGNYIVEAYGDFITSYSPVRVSPRSDVGLGYIPISKQIDSDTYRVVLEWGEYPSDLDSHLVASKRNGGSIHVYFSSKLANEANLDVDDTSSYGPETVTIDKFAELNGFTYSVHNFTARSASSIADPGAYSSRDSLAHSGATVKLYKGGTLLKTYRVPTNQAGTVWNVFSIDASGRITDLNTFEYISEPENVGRRYVPRSVSENGIDGLDNAGWQKVYDDMTDSSQQDDSPEPGLLDPIKIQITDTTSGSGVSDVTYALRIGENNKDGEALDSGILDSDTYIASLPVGTYTLEVSKDGYEPVYANIIVAPDAELTIAVELTPECSPDTEDADSTDGSEVSEDADISMEDATQEDVSIQSEESDLDSTLEDVA